jgi:hypothetical protein
MPKAAVLVLRILNFFGAKVRNLQQTPATAQTLK